MGRSAFAIVSISMAVFLVPVAAIEKSVPGIFGAFFVVVGALLGVGVVLASFTITIDDTGIFASAFGMRTARIGWKDVARIKKVRTAFLGSKSDWIRVEDRQFVKAMAFLPNILGHLTFSDGIENFPDLVERINHYAKLHSIPLSTLDVRRSAQTVLGKRSFAPQAGVKARDQEVPVERFDISEP
jgi:hypothetical protein